MGNCEYAKYLKMNGDHLLYPSLPHLTKIRATQVKRSDLCSTSVMTVSMFIVAISSHPVGRSNVPSAALRSLFRLSDNRLRRWIQEKQHKCSL